MNCPVSRLSGLKPSSAVRLALFAHRTSKFGLGLQARWARSCLLPALYLLIGTSASTQGPALDSEAAGKPLSPVPCLDQTVAFSSGSTWTLCVAAVQRYGLIVTNANFQKSANSPPINILYDGRIGEIFVPYHPGSPRLFDIKANYSPLVLTPAHRPPPPRIAQIIGDNKIGKEIRTYLAWMDDARVRYGNEVVYFAVLDAANYSYIMEWTFRDDGTILARAGSTGPQLSSAFGVGHMHSFTWRLDVDLNGPGDDSVYFGRHVENPTPPSTAVDILSLVETEGSRVWNPERFHTLEIFDRTLQNGHGRPTSYELIPLRSGSARHSEDFTKKDFWVTRFAELPRNSWRTICLTTLPISNQRSMRILLFGTRAQSTTRIMSGMKTITRRPYSGPELSFVQKIFSTGRPFGRPRTDLRRC